MPFTDLHAARDELEAKIMYHTKKQAQDSDSDNEESDPYSLGNRETLSKLRGLGRKHHAPIIRIPQGPPGKVKQYEPTTTSRNTFEVFVEDKQQGDASINKLSDELKDDPDYQVKFL